MNRRTVLSGVGSLAICADLSLAEEKKYKVAVIGHTGRGNFGHGLDKVWLQMPDTEIIAVADADKNGLKKAKNTLKVDAGFEDYRQMFSATKPDLVAVCPRHPDQHKDMTIAAIEAGAKGVYIEKPFVGTLAEADEIKLASAKHGAKIAVAHRNRYHPDLKLIDEILSNKGDMQIGNLLEIRGRGKGDRRGGGEDLWVLGTHVLDLISRLSGKPVSCSAQIFENGQPAKAEHVTEGNEALGPLVGDEIHARFVMENGITAYWDSMANDGTKNKGFGLQLVGSEGTVIIHCDGKPFAHYRKGNPLDPANRSTWEVIGNLDPDSIAKVHSHIIPCRDLIEAIEKKREPVCGISEATTTVEMVMSVFESHFSGGKTVNLPLKNRNHPLNNL